MRVCLNLTCNSAFVHISPHSLLSTVNLPENFGYDLMTPVFHDSDSSRVDFVRKTSSTSFIFSWLVDTISHILPFMILVCYRSITYTFAFLNYWGGGDGEKKNCLTINGVDGNQNFRVGFTT
jgi:hypothetical protein